MEWAKKGHLNSHLFIRSAENLQLSDLWQSLLDTDTSLKDGMSFDSLVQLGSVYVNQKRIFRPDITLAANDLVEIYRKPKRYNLPDLAPRIFADEKDYVIIHKSSGVPSHPTIDNFKENILSAYEDYLNRKLFLPHRLDQDTEGLLLLAKTEAALKYFGELFKSGRIEKKYLALVHGEWKAPGILTHFMKPSPRAPKELSVEPIYGWKECKLSVLNTVSFSDSSLLEIQLLTGRTHQIRAQLAFAGHPISGDRLYGTSESRAGAKDRTLALCCYELSFTEPGTNPAHQSPRTFSLLK